MKMNEMNLETKRLVLQPWCSEDIDTLHQLWTDPDMRRFLWDDKIIETEQVVTEVEKSIVSFQEHGFGHWGIRFKDENGLIGFCEFRHFGEPPGIELLYGVVLPLWGEGIATEAAKALLRYGFLPLELPRIFAGAGPSNRGSFRVMQKIGMRFHEQRTIHGLTTIYYSMSRERFLKFFNPDIQCSVQEMAGHDFLSLKERGGTTRVSPATKRSFGITRKPAQCLPLLMTRM